MGFTARLCHHIPVYHWIASLELTMLRLIVIATAYALLTACAGNAPGTGSDANAAYSTSAEPEVPVVEAPERPFPDDSLHALLVAEFALRRKVYDVALERYMEQLPQLRDAGVAAHTTHLSQFLRRDQDTLQASQMWVDLEPDNAEAHGILATMLIRDGRSLEALPHLAFTERRGKPTHFPALLKGFSTLNAQQSTDLMTGVDALAVEFPENAKLMLTQALMATQRKEYDRALAVLDQLFALEPTQTQALAVEAQILLEQKDEEPFAHMRKVLKTNPEDKPLRLQFARLLTGEDMGAAREQFKILSEQSPRDGDLLFSLALINREMEDYQAAAGYLEQLLALQQRVNEANYYLGRNAEDQEDAAKAVTYYMQVEDSEQYFPANSRIGTLLNEQGQHERSTRWFKEQRGQYPDLIEQLYGLEANILSNAGTNDSAMKTLNSALIELPDSSALLYARAMLSEGQDDLATMEADLRTILATDPDNTTALNALGYSLANRTTRYTEALALITRALELMPSEPAILDSMGWVLFRTGRYEEAVEYLRKAYSEFPDPEVAAHLGEALWASGKTAEAKAVWRSAAQRDPEHQVLLRTLHRLGVILNEISPTAADSQPQH